MSDNKQSEVKACQPSLERLGSRNCYDCERISGRVPGMVFCDLHDEWVNDTDVECADFCGANTGGQTRGGSRVV